MEKVMGLGGLFFRARDPKALADWYEKHLGVAKTPTGPGMEPWVQERGETVFAPFKMETSKWAADKTAMWNFRVRNMDAMVKQLRDGGVTVSDPETYEGIGRFANLVDPEGNAIELWQPSDS